MDLTPQRLSRMIDGAFSKTLRQRQSRVKFLLQIAGRFFKNSSPNTGDESNKASPINLMNTAYNTLIPNLIFANPKARASVDILAYRDYGMLLAEGINRVATRSKLKDTLRLAIADAIVMAGYIKTGEAVGACTIELEGTDFNLAEPFIERVSPDDMILDPMARAWDEQAFVGNRYRADIDKMIESGFGDPDKLQKLAEDISYTNTRDRAEGISKKDDSNVDEPRRYVQLAEIWIPAENRVVTLPYKAGSIYTDFINDVEYSGPPKGQYHQLGLGVIPDNLLPPAPAGIWYDLHILGNRIARKLARQAERNKRVLAYEDDAEEDVNAIADSEDGLTVRVQDLNKIKEVEYGGASDKSYEWMNWLKQSFSEQAGSIESSLSGGGDLPTLGQTEIVQANSSVRLSDMQGIVYDFTADILGDIGYYLHNDPMIELPLVRRVNGIETQDYFTPDKRVGEWYEYNVTVMPFSMARPDPNTQMRRKLEFYTTVIPALVNAAMQLGPGFNLSAALTSAARDMQIDDADEWLNTPQIQQYIMMKMQGSMMTGDPGKAATGGAPPPFNPMQPVPTATAQSGVTPAVEGNQMAQEASAPSQAARASTKDMALARGGL